MKSLTLLNNKQLKRTTNRIGRLLSAGVFCVFALSMAAQPQMPQPVPMADVNTGGELSQRISQNFKRLEETKYQPAHVFLTEEQSNGWPGDTEGRTILGLTLDAQTSHREPVYLDSIIHLIPAHLNELGYMGTVYADGIINEQQISGNGWMLRGLCEYYQWKKDPKVLDVIKSTVHNLFLRGKGHYAQYPIDPAERRANVGAESGSIQNTVNGWMLSSDVGCVFIGMEGLIHAYTLLKEPEIAEVIEEMIGRFLQMNLVEMKAQTHASLTACRGLIRYALATGNAKYIEDARKRFELYIGDGMTENYENYNWFDRFDTWTEPCAVVDSYMVASQLWQCTGNPRYRDIAERIYYNGLCGDQRWNGGFGTNNCPGAGSGTPYLTVSADEAHWCCTMRGGEGLSRVAEYAYYTDSDNTLWINHYGTSSAKVALGDGELTLMQTTDYPFDNRVSVKVLGNTCGKVTLKFAMPAWVYGFKLVINNEEAPVTLKDGFAAVTRDFKRGDDLQLTFEMRSGIEPTINAKNTGKWDKKAFFGPLVLGHDGDEIALPDNAELRQTGRMEWQVGSTSIMLTPVYHLMDRAVTKDNGYRKQILFE